MNFISLIFFAFIAHEGGHFLTAFCFGYRIRFYRDGLRFLWKMPALDPWKQRFIAQMGFGTEFLVGLILLAFFGTPGAWVEKSYLLAYWGFVTLHFLAYPWYAGSNSDFNWMR